MRYHSFLICSNFVSIQVDMVTAMCSQLTYEGLLDEVDKSFSSWHRSSLDNENMICLCEILRACLAWLQLCLEQLHSKTLGGDSSGWSWSCLDVVFGYEGVLNSKKAWFSGCIAIVALGLRDPHVIFFFLLLESLEHASLAVSEKLPL